MHLNFLPGSIETFHMMPSSANRALSCRKNSWAGHFVGLKSVARAVIPSQYGEDLGHAHGMSAMLSLALVSKETHHSFGSLPGPMPATTVKAVVNATAEWPLEQVCI